MLLVPISVHHIPSTGKAAAFSSAGTAADDQESTAPLERNSVNCLKNGKASSGLTHSTM